MDIDIKGLAEAGIPVGPLGDRPIPMFKSQHGRVVHSTQGCTKGRGRGGLHATSIIPAKIGTLKFCSDCVKRLPDVAMESYRSTAHWLLRLHAATAEHIDFESSWANTSSFGDEIATVERALSELGPSELDEAATHIITAARDAHRAMRPTGGIEYALRRCAAEELEESLSRRQSCPFADDVDLTCLNPGDAANTYRAVERHVWQTWKKAVCAGDSFDQALAEALDEGIRRCGNSPKGWDQIGRLAVSDPPERGAHVATWVNDLWIEARDYTLTALCELWQRDVEAAATAPGATECVIVGLGDVRGLNEATLEILEPFDLRHTVDGTRTVAMLPRLVHRRFEVEESQVVDWCSSQPGDVDVLDTVLAVWDPADTTSFADVVTSCRLLAA